MSNDINLICRKYRIENYHINDDGTIDVGDNVDLSGRSLIKLPLKFRNISGNFHWAKNKEETV